LAFGEEFMTAVGQEIDRLEAKVQAAVPQAAHIDLEVD
jgi:hypothetical protein